MRFLTRKNVKRAGGCVFAICLAFAFATWVSVKPVETSLKALQSDAQALQVVDRNGVPLTITYQNPWNVYDNLPLYKMPSLLLQAFVLSEDKRFYAHGGVDWRARASALVQNWKARHVVRGASTITEQVVRMMNPRPRNLWSKWLEGWEAASLERAYDKAEILEFYLNQVPYASNRRGVAQAARYYFDRDLSTLTPKEMLALAVLARAPSAYDLYKDNAKIDTVIARLAAAMRQHGALTQAQAARIAQEKFALARPSEPVNAEHFAAFARVNQPDGGNVIHSTLDAGLQQKVQRILDERVRALGKKNLHNGAALVADHETGEILAWVVAGAGGDKAPAGQIDAVTVPRQPGSSQKPFLYALALDSGWTPATIIEDAPLAEAVGTGLHNFRNYSNVHYGRITLREALANSLNIPALLTVNHVGTEKYLAALHRMGFASLDRGAEIYDEGLALGNGEVTLLEMVQGFAAIARRGVYRPLRYLMDDPRGHKEERIWSEETASLIGNILSDPWARQLEFGPGSVVNVPVQTAVKTGTSTDYRDAWVMGYNHKYVVGIWMGNLDHSATDGVTGGTGPALALRSVFNELNRHVPSRPLWLSPKLVKKDVCIEDPQDAAKCYMRSEFFAYDTEEKPRTAKRQQFEIVKPTDGLRMAVDPRIPLDKQMLPFTLRGLREAQSVEWVLNGETVAKSGEKFLWPVRRGKYSLYARVMESGKPVHITPEIEYFVR